MHTTTLPRGIIALIITGLVSALPTAVVLMPELIVYAKGPLFQAAFYLTGSVLGLSIAFGLAWLRRDFWVSEKRAFANLKTRSLAWLPFLLVGIAGSIFTSGTKAPLFENPSVAPTLLALSLGSLTEVVIVIAMLWKRIGWEKTAYWVVGLAVLPTLAGYLSTLGSFRNLYDSSGQSEEIGWILFRVLVQPLLGLVAIVFYRLAYVKMLKNTHWSLFTLWLFLVGGTVLPWAFAVYSLAYGSLISTLTGIVSAVILYCVEKNAENRPLDSPLTQAS